MSLNTGWIRFGPAQDFLGYSARLEGTGKASRPGPHPGSLGRGRAHPRRGRALCQSRLRRWPRISTPREASGRRPLPTSASKK